MFTVFYTEIDDLGFSYQRSFKVDSASLAKMHVARLRYNGHREAFYRAS
jgi:hypothetical protein